MSSNIFSDEKYQEAAQKAYDFIVRQLNVNDYSLFPRMKENYEDSHTSQIFATVDMPEDAKVNFPKYIYCDQFYDHEYQGVCSGGHKNTGSARHNLGVEITVWTDAKYRSCICPLHTDGSWRSEQYFRETDYYGMKFRSPSLRFSATEPSSRTTSYTFSSLAFGAHRRFLQITTF